MPLPRTFSRHLPPLLLASLLLGVYLSTLAPGLTWANSGSDGGDFITAAHTGGIAHPTGYPLYLILARLFQFIPIGSLAYRTNLMSAVFADLSAVLIYELVTRALDLKHAWLAGLTAGLAFGLAPLVWSQAVITEVYTLQAFLTALILYLFAFPLQDLGQKPLESLRGLVLGLAMGNHVTTVFLLPLILFTGPRKQDGNQVERFASSLTRRLVWFAIGLSLYLTLPLRALTNPPVNWGNPITFERLWWLVSGGLYQSYYLQFDYGEIWIRMQAWASLFVQQFGWPGLVLGIFGLILLFKPSRLYLYTIWMAVAYSAFALVYSSDDSYLYLIPVLVSFAIWMGLAVGHFYGTLASTVMRWGLRILILGFFIFHALGFAGRVDASNDLQAEMFGQQVMSEVPKEALVFLRGDRAVFTTWYFHFALGQRPDLAVVAEELLHFDWYLETLRHTYPALGVPGPLPWAQNVMDANPNRPVCFVEYVERAEILCGESTQAP
jgi:hypothetical protein